MKDTIIVKNWETPVSKYPNGIFANGNIKIETIKYNGFYYCYGLHGYTYFEAKSILIKNIYIKEEGKFKQWMVDDPPHWWAMEEYATKCHGKVLVIGLGLGLIIHALNKNLNISNITVIERNKYIIKIIKPYLPKNLNIIFKVIDYEKWESEQFFKKMRGETYENFDSVVWDLFVGNVDKRMSLMAQVQFLKLKELYGNVPVRIHGFNNDIYEKDYIKNGVYNEIKNG